MLSPLVWVLHAPDDAVPCTSATQAAALVREGTCVVLDDYTTAIRTLIMLGATAEHARYLAEVARQAPQHQDSYTP
jgi:hypothetical protein